MMIFFITVRISKARHKKIKLFFPYKCIKYAFIINAEHLKTTNSCNFWSTNH